MREPLRLVQTVRRPSTSEWPATTSDDEQYLGESGGIARDPAKPESSRNQSNDEKNDGPAHHEGLPFSDRQAKPAHSDDGSRE
jgi:hypothetical protein